MLSLNCESTGDEARAENVFNRIIRNGFLLETYTYIAAGFQGLMPHTGCQYPAGVMGLPESWMSLSEAHVYIIQRVRI